MNKRMNKQRNQVWTEMENFDRNQNNFTEKKNWDRKVKCGQKLGNLDRKRKIGQKGKLDRKG